MPIPRHLLVLACLACLAGVACGDNTGPDRGLRCEVRDICLEGGCASDCSSGLENCDGECIDPQTDRRRCGAERDSLNLPHLAPSVSPAIYFAEGVVRQLEG